MTPLCVRRCVVLGADIHATWQQGRTVTKPYSGMSTPFQRPSTSPLNIRLQSAATHSEFLFANAHSGPHLRRGLNVKKPLLRLNSEPRLLWVGEGDIHRQ